MSAYSTKSFIYGKHVKNLVLLLALATVIILPLKYLSGTLQVMHGASDMDTSLAIENYINHPGLYAEDRFFPVMYEFYPRAGLVVTAMFISVFGRWLGLLILDYILFALFLAGMYFLYFHISGDRKTAFIASLISSYGYEVFNEIFGIRIGVVLPRDFAMVLLPFFLLAILRVQKSLLKTVAAYFLLGLVANIHILSVTYFAFITLFAQFMLHAEEKRFRLKPMIGPAAKSIISLAAFLAGTLPYLLFFLSNNPGDLPLWLVKYRFPYFFQIDVTSLVLVFLLPVVISALFLVKRSYKKHVFMNLFLVSALVFLVAGNLLIIIDPAAMSKYQFNRAAKYLLFPLFLYSASFIKDLPRKAGYVLALLFIVPPSVVLGQLNVQLPDVNLWLMPVNVSQENFPPGFFSDKASFFALVSWVKANTSEDSLFLVSPFDGGRFRAFAERSIVVSYKDGSFIVFSRDFADQWYSTYSEVSSAYQSGSSLLPIAKKYNVDYILAEKGSNSLSLPVSYENRRYIVYRVKT